MLRAYRGASPRIDPTAWLAPGVMVIGDVEIGADSSVWYGSVIRGDVNTISVGERTNIQDQSVLHVTKDRFPCTLGDEVTVGHRAVVHGCRVGDGALVGVGAIVLDGAEIGEEALIAAGAVVTPGAVIRPGTLALGVPAREVRLLEPDERKQQRERALTYVETARGHAASSVET